MSCSHSYNLTFINKLFRIMLSIILIFGILGALTACGGKGSNYGLDKKHPVEVSIWYSCGSKRAAAFEKMIKIFNDGEGKERGIIISGRYFETEKSLEETIESEKDNLPNMIAASSGINAFYDKDISYVNIDDIVAKNTKDNIYEEFISAGMIDKQWRLFPVVKDTQVMAVNLSMWQPFMKEEEHHLYELNQWENCNSVGEDYYLYTRGTSLLCIGSEPIYILAGSHQLGTDLINIEGTNTVFRVDGNAIRRIWDNYYSAFVKGSLFKKNKRSIEDLLEGNVAAATINSSEVSELGDVTATEGDASIAGLYEILTYPQFKDCDAVCPADDTGVAITDKNETENFASMLFLEWLTNDDNNLFFACLSGALPVNKNISNKERLSVLIESGRINMTDLERQTMEELIEFMNNSSLYVPVMSPRYVELKKYLNGSISYRAAFDRKSADDMIYIGSDRKDVLDGYINDDNYAVFIDEFKEGLPKP